MFFFFKKPWSATLPSAASLSTLEMGEDDSLHLREADVSCAFYRIASPEGISQYFVLPPISVDSARAAGIEGLENFDAEDIGINPNDAEYAHLNHGHSMKQGGNRGRRHHGVRQP